MSIVGYTSNGSPIFFGGTNPSKRKSKKKSPNYKCTFDETHKTPEGVAKKNKYICNHCGADLKVKANKIKELLKLKEEIYGKA